MIMLKVRTGSGLTPPRRTESAPSRGLSPLPAWVPLAIGRRRLDELDEVALRVLDVGEPRAGLDGGGRGPDSLGAEADQPRERGVEVVDRERPVGVPEAAQRVQRVAEHRGPRRARPL